MFFLYAQIEYAGTDCLYWLLGGRTVYMKMISSSLFGFWNNSILRTLITEYMKNIPKCKRTLTMRGVIPGECWS